MSVRWFAVNRPLPDTLREWPPNLVAGKSCRVSDRDLEAGWMCAREAGHAPPHVAHGGGASGKENVVCAIGYDTDNETEPA